MNIKWVLKISVVRSEYLTGIYFIAGFISFKINPFDQSYSYSIVPRAIVFRPAPDDTKKEGSSKGTHRRRGRRRRNRRETRWVTIEYIEPTE